MIAATAEIENGQTYEIGVLKPGKTKEYPEFQRGKYRSIFGTQILATGVSTWEQFFSENPLGLSNGVWHVYKIKGSERKWLNQGEPAQQKRNTTNATPELGDTMMPDEEIRTNSRSAEIRRLNDRLIEANAELKRWKDLYENDIKNIRNGMQEQINSLVAENKLLREEKERIQTKYEEQFEVRLQLTQQIAELKHEIEEKKSATQREVQTLKDDIAKEDKISRVVAELVSYYEDKNKPSLMKDFVADTLKEAKPYVGALLEGLVEIVKKKTGKVEEQQYEG